MNYIRIKKLPSVTDIIQLHPLSAAGHRQIMQDRKEIRNILAGKDKRLLIIVGPCSAWPREAVFEYASQLRQLNQIVKPYLKIVMRLYIQKPRTTKGWTGPINQPNPYARPNIVAGIHYTREMMVKVVEMGLPIADECLFTHHANLFSELVAWVAIGARSSEDHEHRIFASAANCPVGMKNPTHGSLNVAVNSVLAAQHSHVATIDGYEVQTLGNAYAHLVLRGSDGGPNYSISHLEKIKTDMFIKKINNPAILIDVSHDNCLIDGKKNFRMQPNIIFEIMDYLKIRPDLRQLVRGFMVESYLKSGNQKIEDYHASTIDLNGLSITDPCLGWEDTKKMLLELMKEVRNEPKYSY